MRIVKQKGVALIAILIVLVLASLILSSYVVREAQVLDDQLRRKATDRLLLLGLSTEGWIRQQLVIDARQTNSDTLTEPWAQEVTALPVEGGVLNGRLIDLDRFVNLNRFTAYTEKKYEVESEKDNSDISLIERVFAQAQIALPTGALESLIDWQDRDKSSTRGGFESVDYQLLDPPYRAADGALSDLAELHLVNGFEQVELSSLANVAVALPDDLLSVNVNTAPKEVLAALWDGIDDDAAATLIAMRESQSWGAVTDFIDDLAQLLGAEKSLVEQALNRDGYSVISVNSKYFYLDIKLRLDDIEMWYRSTLNRRVDGEAISVSVESRSVTYEAI